jgi:hypothetical protein
LRIALCDGCGKIAAQAVAADGETLVFEYGWIGKPGIKLCFKGSELGIEA